MITNIKLFLYTILLGIFFGMLSQSFIFISGLPSIIFTDLIANIAFLSVILSLIFPIFAAYFSGYFIKKPYMSPIYSISKMICFYLCYFYLAPRYEFFVSAGPIPALYPAFYFTLDWFCFWFGVEKAKRKVTQNIQQ